MQSQLLLLIPVAVAALWAVQRYREGAFRRPQPPSAPAPTAPSAAPDEDEPAWEFRPEDYGLVPDDQLDLHRPGPDPETVWARQATASGDWRAASALLANSDPEWRWLRLRSLAAAAAEDDSWVRAWRAAEPGNPNAALVRAMSLVDLAWEVRGAQRADATTEEQFAGFHRLLAQAPPAFNEAARLAPADPLPYLGMIQVATGLGWPHEHMRHLWSEVTARAAHHVGAHAVALQYWCAKWRGSTELMYSFAETAAANAPAGSLLPILRLVARYEELVGQKIDHPGYHTPETTAAIGALLRDVAVAPLGHAWLPAARHLLVWFLRAQRRFVEAAEQLRLVDGYIGALPWTYAQDRRALYTAVRKHIVLAEKRLIRESTSD
ncbi:DUF4034 domain-containing protein [Gandjariella thermophila]|uniref:DUF4034 domain-containing protein n=1 Tax=Gandjariella thermophila TaxID=1931992 RepID=A0A4D4JAM9_9PSEU|nr:DUF4034 domain-containing protein [Gandjariella thermophila]GDY32624.1 hypothetical protein GTS_42570 [Gandjariella thermophila]